MDHLASALLSAISSIESRDVPDEIADEDVRVLEEAFFHLRRCSDSERSRIAEAARNEAMQTTDARRQQSMLLIIENLDP
ncbi:hypothetical protein [Prosthecobacter sp.]|uniref:hypothetical protein n=1 Tax=Prosthecobacter sp. TaxID=1965333 RepID=UPI00378364E2